MRREQCPIMVPVAAAAFALLLAVPALGQVPQPIPNGGVAHGAQDIAAAWLTEPTRRYGHGVLGDDVEAAAVMVETRDGRRYQARLEDDSVFEDLTPRIADIDGDGRDEVWVVRSDALVGARLEAYGLDGDALRRRYGTAPIGQGYRWLNPVGVADFDGDGRREAAYVETPHIGGVLTIVRPDGGQLAVVARRTGYSNHVIGSTRLDLAAIADLDDQEGAEIVLPDQSRGRLAVISLVDGELVERWRSGPLAKVVGALRLERSSDAWIASYRRQDGALERVTISSQLLRP